MSAELGFPATVIWVQLVIDAVEGARRLAEIEPGFAH